MAAIIRDNGRGPEIVGTGVTVFDIMDGMRYRLYPSVMQQLFNIDDDAVDAAIRYVEVHRAELDSAYEALRAIRVVDFPHLQIELDSIRERCRSSWEKSQQVSEPSHGFPPWPDFDKPFIFNRGRGPEIVGSRITVYDIMDYLEPGWPAPAIAWWLRLTVPQVEAAIAYIEAHRAEVEEDYQTILERCKRGNPPALQAKLDALAGSAVAARERMRQGKPLREERRAEPTGRR